MDVVPFWDASALAKRYAPEVGSDVVNVLFTEYGTGSTTTILGYAETFSLLLRKRNRGDMDARTFLAAVSVLQEDVIFSGDFSVLSVEYEDILAGVEIMQQHNLNSTDAAILVTFSRYAQWSAEICVFVSADRRFLRAAEREGFHTLNPEVLSRNDLAHFMRSL